MKIQTVACAALFVSAALLVSADDDRGDVNLDEFAGRSECMTMLSRVFYSNSMAVDSEAFKVGIDYLKSKGKKYYKRKISNIALWESAWRSSYWGQTCDPNSAVYDRIREIGLAATSEASELHFMATLREHRDHDVEVTGADVIDERLDKMLNDPDTPVPVPSEPWLWQDYVLLFAGAPLTFALVGVSIKAFFLK